VERKNAQGRFQEGSRKKKLVTLRAEIKRNLSPSGRGAGLLNLLESMKISGGKPIEDEERKLFVSKHPQGGSASDRMGEDSFSQLRGGKEG